MVPSPRPDIGGVALELAGPDRRRAYVRLSGEFDITNCTRIGEVFASALEAGCTAVQVDMSEVSFIGSASMRELLQARRRLREANVRVTLAAVSPVAHRVMDLLGLDLFRDKAG